jgi:hypothetical protein
MNNPDHMFYSLETTFWVKILKFFDADPGWLQFGSGSGIRNGKKSDPGSGINIPGSGINIPGSGINIPGSGIN